MPDTITALDTASTDELIAALVARHRATLGQACGQLDDLTALVMTTSTLGQAIESRIHQAVERAGSDYIGEHPTWVNADRDGRTEMFRQILAMGSRRPGTFT